MITELTPEQKAELPLWHKKYFDIGSSTEPLNKQGLEKVIKAFYARINKKEPVFIYCESPMAAMLMLKAVLPKLAELTKDKSLSSSLRASLRASFYEGNYFYGNINSYWISFYQFCEHIGVAYEPDKAKLLDEWENLATHAFHWWPKDGLCVCSHKPTAIHWNNEKTRLHADGRKAVEFSDGWGVYCFDGVRLPDKYGALKSKEWQSKWILEEENAELKMTLIKGIGYEKMCQDLEAKKVDSWREYELLRIENVDVEPIQLNKMTCPSTGKIHVHRVPPDIKSAREAIRWSNFGVDAESFAVEH